MTDEELYEWYKGGADKGEMSDQDYELNKNKALSTQGNKLLDSNLANSQTGLAKQQTSAQQSASIGNEKLMKYLGQKQLASGLATGQTGSDFINANNSYIQNRASINNDFSTQQAALLQQYGENKLALDDTAFNREQDIYDKWLERNYRSERDAVGDGQWDKSFDATQTQLGVDNAYREKTFDYTKDQDEKMWEWETEDREYQRAREAGTFTDAQKHASDTLLAQSENLSKTQLKNNIEAQKANLHPAQYTYLMSVAELKGSTWWEQIWNKVKAGLSA